MLRPCLAFAAPPTPHTHTPNRRAKETDRRATMVTIGGVRALKDDVLVVAHPAGDRWTSDGPRGSEQIEKSLGTHNCVMVKPKEIHRLGDCFGGPWTEGAQYKISQVKQRRVYALVHGGELMSALEHVNEYLGGRISFFGDDFKRFTGVQVPTREHQLTGHSRRCFVVRLDRFST